MDSSSSRRRAKWCNFKETDVIFQVIDIQPHVIDGKTVIRLQGRQENQTRVLCDVSGFYMTIYATCDFLLHKDDITNVQKSLESKIRVRDNAIKSITILPPDAK